MERPAASVPDVRELGRRIDDARLSRAHLFLLGTLTMSVMCEFVEIFITTVIAAAMTDAGSSLKSSQGTMLGREHVEQMLTIMALGGVVGAAAIGRISTWFGPMRVLAFVTLSAGILSILAGLSTDFTPFLIARGAAAFLLGGTLGLFYALLTDMLPVAGRGRLITFTSAAGAAGILLAPLIAHLFGLAEPLGMEGWRWTLIVAGCGSLLTAALLSRQPESPRWLASKGFIARAWAALDVMTGAMPAGAWWTAKPPSSNAEDASSKEAPQAEETGGWSTRARLHLVLFAVLMLLCAMSLGGFNTLNTLIMREKGYGLASSIQYSAITFIGMPVGMLLSSLVVDRLPRHILFAAMSFLLALFGLGFSLAPSLPVVLLCGILWTLLSAAYGNLVMIYAAEVFPPKIRYTATGISSAVGRFSGVLVPVMLLPLLLDHGPVTLFAVIALMLSANGILSLACGPRLGAAKGTIVKHVEGKGT